jgi:phage baseplate assembly protein V
MMSPADIARLLAPLQRRVMLAIGRATLRGTSAGGGLQRVQASLLPGETRGEVEHLQPYGFTSRPQPGAEALVVHVGGDRGHPVCVIVDDPRARPGDLAAGEVCVYGPRPGQRIRLKADGTIEIEASTLRVVGDVQVTGDVVAGTVSLRGHRHGGVQAGGSQTGAPS